MSVITIIDTPKTHVSVNNVSNLRHMYQSIMSVMVERGHIDTPKTHVSVNNVSNGRKRTHRYP